MLSYTICQVLLHLRSVTSSTLASVWLDKLIKVLRAVVVAKLLSGVNILQGFNKNAIPLLHRFTIRIARMVDVTCEVASCTAVDGPLGVYLKKVPRTLFLVCLCGGDDVAYVFYVHTGFDMFDSKEAESCTGATDAQ
jgi:hypothetical protein